SRGEDDGERRREDERSGRCDGGEPAERIRRQGRGGEAGELERLAVVDAERGGVEQRDEECAVGRREAVEAPLLEPLHLVRLDVGAARGFLDRQLALQARVRERRLVGRNDGFERAYGLHPDSLRSAFP